MYIVSQSGNAVLNVNRYEKLHIETDLHEEGMPATRFKVQCTNTVLMENGFYQNISETLHSISDFNKAKKLFDMMLVELDKGTNLIRLKDMVKELD